MSLPTPPNATEQLADQARRNKRLALIHVAIALAVLALFVFSTVQR